MHVCMLGRWRVQPTGGLVAFTARKTPYVPCQSPFNPVDRPKVRDAWDVDGAIERAAPASVRQRATPRTTRPVRTGSGSSARSADRGDGDGRTGRDVCLPLPLPPLRLRARFDVGSVVLDAAGGPRGRGVPSNNRTADLGRPARRSPIRFRVCWLLAVVSP
jgi:hypothetical protein